MAKQGWQDDEALYEGLRNSVEKGGWTAGILFLGDSGWVTSDKTIRNFFKKRQWYPYNTLASCESLDTNEIAEIATEEVNKNTEGRLFRSRLLSEIAKREAKILLDQAKEEALRLAEKEAALTSLAKAFYQPVRAIYPPRIVSTTKTPIDFVLFLADNHIGKCVREDRIGLGYAYNRDIIANNFAQIQEELYDYVCQFGGQVRNLYTQFGGDNLDGMMREGHPYYIDLTDGEQQLYLVDLVTNLWNSALSMPFSTVVARGVGGNHGRVAKLIDDRPYTDNKEFVALNMAKRIMGDSDHFRAEFVERETDYFRLADTKNIIISEHGHRAKGIYGESGPVSGFRRRLGHLKQSVLAQDYTLALMAHVHQEILHFDGNNRHLVVSGSGDGGDDWVCKSLGKDSSASQWLLAMHPTDGLVGAKAIRFKPKREGLPLGEY